MSESAIRASEHESSGHRLDFIDETFIAAPAESLVAALCDERTWSEWFADLSLRCFDDRGAQGKRWAITGALVGTAEIWLEQLRTGTIVHAFVQADPAATTRRRRATRARLEKRYGHRLKAHIVAVKDAHDLERPAGTLPPLLATAQQRVEGGKVASGEHRTIVRGSDQEAHDGQPDDE